MLTGDGVKFVIYLNCGVPTILRLCAVNWDFQKMVKRLQYFISYAVHWASNLLGGEHILINDNSGKNDAVIGGVQCVGTEPELMECFHASIGSHNCGPQLITPNIIISCSGMVGLYLPVAHY